MRAVVQRVTESNVTVDGETVGSVGPGLMVLIGVSVDDTDKDLKYIVDKVPNLRIFDDENGVSIRAATIQGDDKTRISTLRLTLDVHSREEMNKVIQALRNKSDILDVYRATR